MTDKKKTDNKNVMVYQSNPLIEGRRDFTIIEARLFYLGLRELTPKLTKKEGIGQTEFLETVIPTKEIIELFRNDKYYNTLHGVCLDMAKKTVDIKNVDGGFDVVPLFSRLAFRPGAGLVLEFNHHMKPYLLELVDGEYTRIPFEIVWQLRSGYAVRILELLLQYQNTKTHERTMTVEELRRCLSVPDGAYNNRVDIFRQRVIDSSIKEINEKTAYKVEYEKVKEGRKITGFKFKLYLPKQKTAQKQKAKAKEARDIIAGLAEGKAMTGNNTSSDSRKRPQPDFNIDKNGNKLEYEQPVRIKDGKTIL